MTYKLHEYQKACLSWLLDKPYAGLLLEPGLGKTLITLAAIDALFILGDISRVLVLATKRIATDVWPEEIGKWGFDIDYSVAMGSPKQRGEALAEKSPITITNYDNFVWLTEKYHQWPFDMVVIDESSHFKNANTKRFKALRKIRAAIKRVVILTGTPAPNSLLDLWPQIYALDTGDRLEKFIGKYRQKYFTPGASSGHIVYRWDIRKGAEDTIHSKISDICVSMKCKDYLKLPKRTDTIIKLNLTDELRRAYKQFKREQVLSLEDTTITAVNAAVLCGKLMQFTSGAIYEENITNSTKGEFSTIHDLKIETLKNTFCELQGSPLLVFYQFLHEKERILRAIPEAVDIKDAKISDWNEGKIPLLLAHPMSAGHGLNLQQGGSVALWFSLTWSLEQYQQANARLDRQGQTKPVVIMHLVLDQTIDEKALAVLQGKGERQETLMQALKYALEETE